MRNQLLQDYADSILIESLAAQELGIIKQASLFDNLGLSGVAESIKNFTKEHINPNGPGGYVGSVLNLMAPSVLFRANPIIGILYLIATQFGFDMQGMFTKISNALKPKLESGKQISSSEISEIGKSIIASEAGEPVTACDDMFEPIRKFSVKQNFFEAFDFGNSASGGALPQTPLLMGNSGGGMIQRIFGQLFSSPGRGKSRAIWLLGGFVIWIIKTILAGAGLVAGAEAISGALGHKKPEVAKPAEQVSATQNEAISSKPPAVKQEIKELAKQQPTSNEIWVLPVVNGNLEDTIMSWVKEFYPNKFAIDFEFENKLKNSSSWDDILNQLKDPKKVSKKYFIMPSQFSSRKEVVDEAMKGITL